MSDHRPRAYVLSHRRGAVLKSYFAGSSPRIRFYCVFDDDVPLHTGAFIVGPVWVQSTSEAWRNAEAVVRQEQKGESPSGDPAKGPQVFSREGFGMSRDDRGRLCLNQYLDQSRLQRR